MGACAFRPERPGEPSFRTTLTHRPGFDLEPQPANQTKKPERALRAFRRAQPVRSIVTIPEPAGAGTSKVRGFYARGAEGQGRRLFRTKTHGEAHCLSGPGPRRIAEVDPGLSRAAQGRLADSLTRRLL